MSTLALNPTFDSWIDVSHPTTAHNGPLAADIAKNFDVNGGQTRYLAKFDLATLPSGATITAANLVLTSNGSGGIDASVDPSLIRCAVSNNPFATGATWNTYDGTNAWGTVGGNPDSTLKVDVSVTGAQATGTGTVTWSIVAICQDARTNHGDKLYVVFVNTATPADNFASSLEIKGVAAAAGKPTLTLTYTAMANSTQGNQSIQVNQTSLGV